MSADSSAPAGSGPTRVIFAVTEDWYFCSHRLPIARALRDAGYEVAVATRVSAHGHIIEGEGFHLYPLNFQRSGLNLLADLGVLWRLFRIYRSARPQVVHHVALKPVLYGSIAARLAGVPAVVNAFMGLGYLNSAETRGVYRALQPLARWATKIALKANHGRVIVQNQADWKTLIDKMGLRRGKLVLIRGSGVDTRRFAPSPEPAGPVRIAFVSRLLWEKGVGDLVKAAELLAKRAVDCVITLVGEPDARNPRSVSDRTVREWAKADNVEWWGWRSDIEQVWATSHIACLPTYYGEGVPLSLLEAASCGRAIVCSDNPGCLEVVEDGVNGLVVPAKDPEALADAIEELVGDAKRRRKLGAEGRRRILDGFSREHVIERTLMLYGSL